MTGRVTALTSVPADRRIAIASALAFVAITAALFVAELGERSPYILQFVGYPYGYGLFGYTFVANAQPMMAENTYFLDQTLLFAGAGSRLSMYFTSIRPLYAFLASLVAPAIGDLGALKLANYLSWLLAGAVAWRYTRRLETDRSAPAIAVILVAFGLGFVIHLHDYSPHLFAFAVYFLGTLIVHESGVWQEPRPWRTHLRLGVFLALASLTYSTGLVLAAAYAVVAIRRNRWRDVVGAVLIGVSSQYVWTLALNVMNSLTVGRWSWINVPGQEQELLKRSVHVWVAALPSASAFWHMLFDNVVQFAGIECPLLIAAAIICWIAQARSKDQRIFDVTFAVMPIAVALVYVHVVITRGYLAYGMSLWIYSTIAVALARGLANRGRVRALAAAMLITIVASQAAWSTSHLRGYLIPIKLFHGFGTLAWATPFLEQWHLPQAQSLTDGERTPVLFGGAATIRDAGAVVAPPAPTASFTFRFGLVVRIVLVCYVLWAVLVWTPQARLPAIVVLACVLWIGPVAGAKLLPPRPTPVYSTFDSERVRAGDEWRYSIDLGPDFLSAAHRAARNAAIVDFMVGGLQPPFAAQVTADGEELASANDGRQVLRSALSVERILDALDRSRRIEIRISSDHDMRMFGWQRPNLPGRHLAARVADLSPITALPGFEMRILNIRGAAELIGF